MKNIVSFISKYALYFLIAGVLFFIIAISSISNLPNPSVLPPIYVQAEYYKPLRFYSTLRIFSILLILISAFFFVQGMNKKASASNRLEIGGFCPNCGAPTAPEDRFCNQCGVKRDI